MLDGESSFYAVRRVCRGPGMYVCTDLKTDYATCKRKNSTRIIRSSTHVRLHGFQTLR